MADALSELDTEGETTKDEEGNIPCFNIQHPLNEDIELEEKGSGRMLLVAIGR